MITKRYTRHNPLVSYILFKAEILGQNNMLCAGMQSAVAMTNNIVEDLFAFFPFCAYFHKLRTQA